MEHNQAAEPKLSVISMMRKSSIVMASEEEDIVLEPLLNPQVISIGHYADGKSSVDRVKQILDSDVDAAAIQPRPIFCELLYHDCTAPCEEGNIWRESSRWVKFEETVEEAGTRWSKPHVTLLNIRNLLQVKNSLAKGISLFDVSIESFPQLVDLCCRTWAKRYAASPAETEPVKQMLLGPKQHLVKNKPKTFKSESVGKLEDMLNADGAVEESQRSTNNADTFSKTAKINVSLLRKLPEVSESACALVGYSDHIIRSVCCFVRLHPARLLLDITELPISTRFVYILLVPTTHYYDIDVKSIGRSFGVLMVDEIFSKVAYRTKNGIELGYAVEEFLDQCVIVPAGKWNRSVRWEPPENQPLCERKIEEPTELTGLMTSQVIEEEHLRRTGRLFGGFIDDIKLKLSWYKSDITDAFKGRLTQSLAAAIFLFFANISKIITFGGVMDNQLHKQMGAMENVLAGGICGMIYALFAGQPLCVLSATGPCLVFEVIMYQLCESAEWSFLAVRAWLGIWTAVFLVIYVAVDASVLVALITRFTEEAFATMISIIFLVKAFDELFEIKHAHPVTTRPQDVLADPTCACYVGSPSWTAYNREPSNFSTESFDGITYSNLTGEECTEMKGIPRGSACYFSPEIFIFSIILMLSTFVISLLLKFFRHTSFFTSKVRNTVADFNAIIAIVIMTMINYLVGIKVPCLNVPADLTPTTPRSWFVNPLNVDQWWISFLMILPAAFFSILVMMDQNITSVIINRPDNKLVKGYGYHLDLAVIAFSMVICALFGLPFYVAATVISLLHVDSLRIMSETAAPGEKARFLGIREQRVTAFVAHLLIGLAVFLTPAMRYLPMPVLLGVFLYIGIVSLSGQQFGQRVLLLFMPMKHQPDYQWLRTVRMRRVHLFTAIQLISFALLLFVEEHKKISMIFPLMLFVMVLIRKIIMERIFTKKELIALDDPLPTWRELFEPSKRVVSNASYRRPSRSKMSTNLNSEENVALQKLA